MKIFLIGTSRSGSNMLRVMLNQSADIDAPHPPFFMEKMRPFQATYGDLSIDANYRRLVDNACRLVETNHVPWGVPLDRDALVAASPARSVIAAYDTLMGAAAAHKGKRSWLCKASGNVHFLPEIERYFGEDAYFLHLVRDGRDVAVSYLRAVVGEKTTYHIGSQWAHEQRLCVELQRRTPVQRFMSVRYEDILDDPEKELRRICDWLGIAFTQDIVNFHESEEAAKTSDKGMLWVNLKRPVMADNKNKWERELSMEQVMLLESIAKEMLDHFGYATHYVNEKYPPFTFDEADLHYLNRVNNRMKRHALARIPQRDLDIRAAQDELIREMIREMPNVPELRFPAGSVVLPLWKDVMRERGLEYLGCLGSDEKLPFPDFWPLHCGPDLANDQG